MADITGTLDSWSTTSSSNQPDNADAVGPNTLADNQRVIQAVVRQMAASSTIASAATTDLSTINEAWITVSGTTTITAFGTLTVGMWKWLRFSGALTLTHNATSLILPGAANITTVAGDCALFKSEGSGNWRCYSYIRSSALPALSGANTDITSMSNLTTLSSSSNLSITGANLQVTRAVVGSADFINVTNTDNTNTASSARLGISTGGASAGDPYILFDISGVVDWTLGLDNSDSDKFKLSASSALGTTDVVAVDSSQNVLIVGTGGLGYGTGTGGTVTQITSKATNVTLDKTNGDVTMHNAALAAGAIVTFSVISNKVVATDTIILNQLSGSAAPGSYGLNARAAAGSFAIDVRNNSAGSLSEAIVIRFVVIKSVNS